MNDQQWTEHQAKLLMAMQQPGAAVEFLNDEVERQQSKIVALAAELAQERSDRQREHYLRVRLAGTVEALEAALRGIDFECQGGSEHWSEFLVLRKIRNMVKATQASPAATSETHPECQHDGLCE